MAGPHESATPVPLAHSNPSRPLAPTPPRALGKLSYGSSSGYRVVSAAGLQAWRRGPKRASDRDDSKSGREKRKKGPGMGYEGTPGRRGYKRTSGTVRASIGTQSTPKASASYRRSDHHAAAAADDDLTSTSSSFPILTSSTNDDSDEEAKEANDRSPNFAIGATTIAAIDVGHDVFGLTIAIDPDGTTREISAEETLRARSLSQVGWSSLSGDNEVGHTDDEDVEHPRWGVRPITQFRRNEGLEGWTRDEQDMAEMESLTIPVDFGDSDSVEVPEDLALEEDQEADHLFPEPLCKSSVQPRPEATINEFTYEDEFLTIIDHSKAVPLDDELDNGSAGGNGPSESVILRKRISRDKIASRPKTPLPHRKSRHPPLVPYPLSSMSSQTHPHPTSPETGRGLKLSVLRGTPPPKPKHDVTLAPSPPFPSPSYSDSLSPLPLEDGLGQHEAVDSPGPDIVEDVEPANRLSMVPSRLFPDFDREAHRPEHSLSEMMSARKTASDVFGLLEAERLAKGYKPERYYASSEASSPPLRTAIAIQSDSPIMTPSTSSTSVSFSAQPSIVKSTATVWGLWPERHDRYPVQDLDSWKGIWKGGHDRLHSSTVSKVKSQDVSREADRPDVRFIEPVYTERASAARDARIAHYKDLDENYALHVEGVQF